jgi:hypothetical protein
VREKISSDRRETARRKMRMDELMMPAAAHAPLRELVAGLDDVAGWAIPYARLPRRAGNAYSAEFLRWSDIAGQTVHSLVGRAGAGEGTVRALLVAAQDTVAKHELATTGERVGVAAAVRRLLDELDARDRVMLSARVWTSRPLPQGTVAHRLGVAKVWVHRHQPRAEARFEELLADPVHHEVSEHAAALGRRLGPYLPADVVVAELSRLDVDPDSEAAQVLLHLAGPYAQRGEWFENSATGGKNQAAVAGDGVFRRCAAPSTESLVQALTDVGMAGGVAATYVRSRVDWRCFGDVWVRWGDSAANKAEAILHARGAPATAEDMFAAIGPGPTTPKAMREALYGDERFVRATRQSWGLRAWGIDEYAGISEAIGARIDASGGEMNVEELVRDLRTRIPDVAESSIRINLNTLAFITERDVVRRRRDADGWPRVAPLHTVRGAFRNGHNEIRFATTVTGDVLRGSGQPIHPAVATALGVSPGQRRSFTGPHGPLEVAWRLSSTNGPSIGSVQAPARSVGAAPTDTLVLAFNLDEASLHVSRIGAEVSGVARLRPLLGRSVRSPGAALAASLGCTRADVAAVLRKRGDGDLADLVQE